MKRLIIIWIILIIANSAASFINETSDLSHQFLVSAIIILSFFKVRLIGIEFMELRTAPVTARVIYEVWVVVLALIMIILITARPI